MSAERVRRIEHVRLEPSEEPGLEVAVRYNPFDAGEFNTVEGDRPVTAAGLVKIDDNRCYMAGAGADVESDDGQDDLDREAD